MQDAESVLFFTLFATQKIAFGIVDCDEHVEVLDALLVDSVVVGGESGHQFEAEQSALVELLGVVDWVEEVGVRSFFEKEEVGSLDHFVFEKLEENVFVNIFLCKLLIKFLCVVVVKLILKKRGVLDFAVCSHVFKVLFAFFFHKAQPE